MNSVEMKTKSQLLEQIKDLQAQVEELTNYRNEHIEMEKIWEVLLNISNAVMKTQNISKLIIEIHKEVGKLMYAKNFYVCLVHDINKNLFTFPYYKDVNEEDVEDPDEVMEITKGLTYHVMQTKELLLGNKKEIEKIGVIGTLPESWLGAPLITETGEVLGVIAVQHYEKEAYTEKDAMVMSIIAGNIAGALKYKKAQTALQQSEAKFKDITFSIGEWIWEVDHRGRYTYCSDKVDEILGYSTEEVLGKTPFDFMPEKEAELVRKQFFKIAQNGDSFRDLENWNIRKDGKKVCLSTSGVPMFNEKGKKIGYRGVDKDITRRKKSEEALKKAKEEAEEFSKYLEKANLKANELAVQAKVANAAKSEFLANMSHEIRTPMNGVIGMTGLLLETDLNDEQREFTDTIRTSGQALLEIINDILDFSKIESGKIDLEIHPFSIRECVEDAIDLMSAKASEKSIEMTHFNDPNIPESIHGDNSRLRQIIVNLLGNAIKFTMKGEIELTTTVVKDMNDNKIEIQFAVRDTGIGIPKDKMSKLFKSFSQVDASITRRFGGTGLGLAISKQLSELMGGKMWVESEVGKGSTFHFTIIAEKSDIPSMDSEQGKNTILKGKRILIVDDNLTNRRLLEYQTKSWDMIPTLFPSGAETLEYMKSNNIFDIAVLDMQMPEMDGLSLAKQIKILTKDNPFPMIVLSSIGQMPKDNKEILEIFSTHLMKPIKKSQIFKSLLSVLERRSNDDRFRSRKIILNSNIAENNPLKILIAEDNLVNQKVADRMLKKMGYNADIVNNGSKVLTALEKTEYDVIFMDVQMPVMDGIEATQQVRKKYVDDYKPIIIAMTANAMQGDREKCISAGMNDYISKPINPKELIDALNKINN